MLSLPAYSPIEAKLFMGDLGAKKFSQIYRSLVTHSASSLEKLRTQWVEDVGPLDEDDWREALAAPRSAAISMRLRLIQFKFLHRVYFTRARLWRAGLIASPECLRCGEDVGTLLHTVWQCPPLCRFWGRVLSCLSEVLGWELPTSPRFALLHVMEGVGGNIYKRHLLWLGLVLAKRDIALVWKASQAPPLSKWKAGLDFCMGLEKPIFEARGCPNKHYKIWQRWAEYRGIWLDPPNTQEI